MATVTVIPSVSHPQKDGQSGSADMLTLVNGTDILLLMTGDKLLLRN